MRIEIEFDTDGAAFERSPCGEPARIIHSVAYQVHAGESEGRLSDADGNDVGTWAITDRSY